MGSLVVEQSAFHLIANKHESHVDIVATVTAKDGAQVIIKVESLEYTVFQLEGSGFKASESLNIIVQMMKSCSILSKRMKMVPIPWEYHQKS